MAWAAIKDLGAVLEEPPEGEQQLRGHDPVYGEISDGFDAVRDTCNKGIDTVNGWIRDAGLSEGDFVTKLPEGSLDDYVVFPLSGNYYRIQQNGSACGILRDGMSRWGDNFGSLVTNSVLAFEGRAHTAFAAHLGAYSLVMKGIGGVMSSGSVVFETIARTSERIAIRVERTLIEMGKRLLRVAKVVAKRVFGGVVGVANLILEITKNGTGVITEVFDDVKWCLEAIDKCFELKDEVTAWAESQADRLAAFKELTSIVDELPTIDLGVPLADVEIPDLESLDALLKDLDIDFGESKEGADAEDELNDAGDDLANESGYVDPTWTEACVVPPMGMEQYAYDPSLPLPNPTFNGLPEAMDPPTPNSSTEAYYAMYELFLQTPQGRYSPPAQGLPADG